MTDIQKAFDAMIKLGNSSKLGDIERNKLEITILSALEAKAVPDSKKYFYDLAEMCINEIGEQTNCTIDENDAQFIRMAFNWMSERKNKNETPL
jgi:hypothetical protein